MIELDRDPAEADWIKGRTWEFPTDADMFLQVIGGADQLEHFMALPVSEAMPDSLRIELAVATGKRMVLGQKFDPGQERDENGRWTSGGGGGTTVAEKPAAMDDKEFLGIWKQDMKPGVARTVEESVALGQPADKNIREALNSYTDTGYLTINSALREDVTLTDRSGVGVYNQQVEALDEWTHSDTLDRDTLLYRTGAELQDWRVPTEAGTTFTDHGFVSTHATTDFGHEGETLTRQQIEIAAPTGTPFGLGTYGEREVILPRDSTFEVTGASEDGMHVQVRLVKAG